MKRFLSYFLLAFLFITPYWLEAKGVAYLVDFEGLEDKHALQIIKSQSELTTLKKAPSSLNALRYRAEEDIPGMLKILRALGYYEAKITIRVEETFPQARVIVYISSGPLYTIDTYTIHFFSKALNEEIVMETLSLPAIGIYPGMTARSNAIQNAETKILKELANNGYPLASLTSQDIVATAASHSLAVTVYVDTGPFCRFGSLTIEGNESVKTRWFKNKILWRKGDIYNQQLVDRTQKELIETGLFSSVLISPANMPDADQLLPMGLEVGETLHRNVSAGISYQTVFGPGATFGWENRNVGGEGQIIRLQGDITRISHTGILSYRIPNFRRKDQDFNSQLQAMQETIHPTYAKQAYSLTGSVERHVTPFLRMAVGGRFEKMFVSESLQNGQFWLAEIPLFVGWSNVNNILNPTRGMNIGYNFSPALNFDRSWHGFLEQKLTLGNYLSVLPRTDFLVLAQQITIGSILSQHLKDIPLPERFLGGSEDDLRGYSYLTVSPLRRNANGKRKPLGGRSAIYYSVETRFRITENFGVVPFFDLGNVWLRIVPPFDGKWRKSIGLGLRYFTFFGPMRCDIGFPLDRRHGIDHKWRILVSIGQTF